MSNPVGYSESTERVKVEQVPLSHLSIETGHFYMRDLVDVAAVRTQFRRIAPLVRAFTESARVEHGPQARVSTCFLVDDYFRHTSDPAETLDLLLGAADDAGVTIDYLAREAGCWEAPTFVDGVMVGEPIRLAEMVAARIVAEPSPRQSTGRRPPVAESGWLCNGKRSSDALPLQAMRDRPYEPPEQFSRREHSIFLDVEMWSKHTEMVDGVSEVHTKWSCPFLASVWQLLRLGVLRHEGASVVRPQRFTRGDWTAEWWEMPTVMQLNPDAPPFAAYRTLSILPQRYLEIEHAVRVILDHIQLDAEVLDQTVERGDAERPNPVAVSRKVTERLGHVLLDGS